MAGAGGSGPMLSGSPIPGLEGAERLVGGNLNRRSGEGIRKE